MINTLVMVGVIERVHVSESKRGNASGSILMRYGDDRNYSGGSVEFINAVLLRIPPYRLNAIRDRLKEGAFVHVIGHVQGVLKQQAGQGILDSELVADRIDFVQGLNSVKDTYRKGRDQPAHSNGNGKEPAEPGEPAAEASVSGGLAAERVANASATPSEEIEPPAVA